MRAWEGDPGWGSEEPFCNHRGLEPCLSTALDLGALSLSPSLSAEWGQVTETTRWPWNRGGMGALRLRSPSPSPCPQWGLSTVVLGGATAVGVIPECCPFRGPYSPCSGKPGWTENLLSPRWLEFPQPSVDMATPSEEISLRHKKGKQINYYFEMKFVEEIRSFKARDNKNHLPWGKRLGSSDLVPL